MGKRRPLASMQMKQKWEEWLADGCAAIQRDVNWLEKWVNQNIMKFTKGKRQNPHLGKKNSRHHCTLGADWLKSSLTEKDLRVLVINNLSMCKQCVLVVKNDNSILSYVRQSQASRSGELNSPLLSTGATHLEIWVHI